MINAKYKKLLTLIRKYKKALVALSGGCDSSLLVYAAKEALGSSVLAVTAESPFFPGEEKERARHVVKMFNIDYKLIDIGDAQLEKIQENPSDRCYVCKTMIFSKMVETANKNGCDVVFDGSNIDDTSEYRPGFQALKELKVVSPLKEAGLTKDEIRELSTRFGLPTANTPSFSCLATRFPYGSTITREKLGMLEKAETYLHTLGFSQLRVRLHDGVARIEVLPHERLKFFNTVTMDKIAAEFKLIGFDYAALDMSGYKSGSMDIHIKKEHV